MFELRECRPKTIDISNALQVRCKQAATYLDTEQEEVQIEVQARQNILVHHGHHNGRTAVCQNREGGVIGDGDTGAGCRSRRRRSLELLIPLVDPIHVDGVVVGFLVFDHVESRIRGVIGCLLGW